MRKHAMWRGLVSAALLAGCASAGGSGTADAGGAPQAHDAVGQAPDSDLTDARLASDASDASDTPDSTAPRADAITDLPTDAMTPAPPDAGPSTDAAPDGPPPCVPAPAELCNGLDDDCDGRIDEDLPLQDFLADPDGDGFAGPSAADVQPSCAAWLATGASADGLYPIDPDGPEGPAPRLDAYCDMAAGGWTRVFFHDVAGGYWGADADPLSHGADQPLGLRHSLLSHLEAFRSSDGALDLRLSWPDSAVAGANVWRQTSNPASEAIAGCTSVDVAYTDNGWGGLERNRFNDAAFIDGTVGAPNWFYALGTTGAWGDPPGIPSYGPSVPRVALWVRPDDAPVLIDPPIVSACGLVPGVAAAGGDCAPGEPRAHPGAAEVCDTLDNDCNGEVDEGFPYTWWYPDRDGDGLGASAGSSCASLLAAGHADDGVYEIHPAGPEGASLRVFCDMTRDGGGWTRVFHHDVAGGYFASDADARARNADAPASALYSILDHLEAFRSSDGRFDLRIEWPETAIAGRNIWRQASDPTTAPVAGYEAVDVDYTDRFWGGLELSDRAETYLDGSVQHAFWFYSVGSQVPWNDPPGIPSYDPPAARVSLWVRPDDAQAGGPPVWACTAPEDYAEAAGDCDDEAPDVHPGADERCNGRDDDCDGETDEGCPFGDLTVATMPQALHFYARDRETDRCTFVVAGETVGAATEAQVSVTRDGQPYTAVEGDGGPFALEVTLEPGLTLYDVTVAWGDGGGFWRPVARAGDVLCGDVFLIDGQSNAVAIDYHDERLGDAERNTFVRSFGSAVNDPSVANDRTFSEAVAVAGYTRGSIGQWGLRLANAVKDALGVPILVINGAVGGTRVDQHQRNDANPADLGTIYGRLLWRVREAGLAGGVRAIFWHQGESDGAQPYDQHLALFTAMYDDWLADYPAVEGVFPFQVRAGCGNPTWDRNVHRDLPGLLPRVLGHMSTTGVDGHDGCHFFHRTYMEWGERMARVVLRDLYGVPVDADIDAPDPVAARWLSPTELEIDYGDTGGSLVVQPGAEQFFTLSDGAPVLSARVAGQTLVLMTARPSDAAWVSFVDVPGDIPWLVNALGIGGFAFYEFPIAR